MRLDFLFFIAVVIIIAISLMGCSSFHDDTLLKRHQNNEVIIQDNQNCEGICPPELFDYC